MDDITLVQRAQLGDAEAFAALVRQVQSALLACARQLTRNADDAEDLAQETLLEAYRCLPTLREPGKFRAWLFSILRHQCCNARKRRHPEISLDEVGDLPAVLPTHGDELQSLLDLLPDADRELLAARYLQGLEFHEIAKLYGTNAVAIRMRVSRARARLRQLAKHEEEEMRSAFAVLLALPTTDLSHRVITEVSTMTQLNITTAAFTATAKPAFLTGIAGKSTLALAVVLALGGGYYAAGTKGMVPLPPQMASAAIVTVDERADGPEVASAADPTAQTTQPSTTAQVPAACQAKMQHVLDVTLQWINDHDGQLPRGRNWAQQVGLSEEEVTCPEGVGRYEIVTSGLLAGSSSPFVNGKAPLILELKPGDSNWDYYYHADDNFLVGWTDGQVSTASMMETHRGRERKCIANLRKLVTIVFNNGGLLPTVEEYNQRLSAFEQRMEEQRLTENEQQIAKQLHTNSYKLTCPMGNAADTYAYNRAAAGVRMSDITSPEKLVLFYEARNGKPDFRHQLNTMYCAFADGHIQRVSPEQFKTLNVK